MELSQETQERISQLQLFEQKLHGFLTQKQTFQSQILEVENAIKELKSTEGPAYKIVGNVMLKVDNGKLTTDLEERLEVLSIRVKNIEKQEKGIREEAEKIQSQVMEEIKGDDNNASPN